MVALIFFALGCIGQQTFSHIHNQGGGTTAAGIFEIVDGYLCYGVGGESESSQQQGAHGARIGCP